jgi:hypothetical protein
MGEPWGVTTKRSTAWEITCRALHRAAARQHLHRLYPQWRRACCVAPLRTQPTWQWRPRAGHWATRMPGAAAIVPRVCGLPLRRCGGWQGPTTQTPWRRNRASSTRGGGPDVRVVRGRVRARGHRKTYVVSRVAGRAALFRLRQGGGANASDDAAGGGSAAVSLGEISDLIDSRAGAGVRRRARRTPAPPRLPPEEPGGSRRRFLPAQADRGGCIGGQADRGGCIGGLSDTLADSSVATHCWQFRVVRWGRAIAAPAA